jgi:hypothetical protein
LLSCFSVWFRKIGFGNFRIVAPVMAERLNASVGAVLFDAELLRKSWTLRNRHFD